MVIITVIGVFIFGFWVGTFYIQVQRSEEIRCEKFDPTGGNYDTKACVQAGCKVDGKGEWSCIPKLPIYF